MLGLLGYKSNWLIKSNAESGIGYSDILVEVPTNRTGIVIEIKYAEDGDLDAACGKASKQIEEKDYVAKLKQDGMKNFIKYGVAPQVPDKQNRNSQSKAYQVQVLLLPKAYFQSQLR